MPSADRIGDVWLVANTVIVVKGLDMVTTPAKTPLITGEELLAMGERSAALGVRWNPIEWAGAAMSFLR